MQTGLNALTALTSLKAALIKNGLKLKTAESFTGGLIAATVTSQAGASEYFKEGIVCYSNESKAARLAVNPLILDEFSAVSLATITQMLKGISDENIMAIATTGNAGPIATDGETGVCFVGASIRAAGKTVTLVKKLSLTGTRAEIINQGVLEAINCALALASDLL